MAGDGILTIGATVDKTGVEAGLTSIQDGVQMTVQQIAVQVEETCARTKAAWNKLGDDVKAASQTVSAESIKVAEATKAQTAALADLRRASLLTKDAKIDEAASTAILAAAQNKVVASTAEVMAAKKAEAAAVASAAEEEALSSNVFVAAFQRAALGVREACGEIQEKLVETAETGKLTGEGMVAGFAGLSTLLGAGIAVGFAAHFLDETAKVNVELGHLSEKTGIAVPELAALRAIVKESGGDFDAVGTGIVKMEKALADSATPSKALTAALAGINLNVAELKSLSPEEKLVKVAAAFAASENAGNKAAAAIALFGRGGQALIPTLVSEGAQLQENIKAKEKDTGVTQQAADASLRWTQNMAKLSEAFQRFGNFAVESMHYVGAAFDAIGAAIQTVLEGFGTVVVALAKEILALGKAFDDVRTLNVTAFGDDLKRIMHAGVDEVQGGIKDIKAAWASVGDLWKKPEPVQRKLVADTSGDGEGNRAGSTPTGASGKAGTPAAAAPVAAAAQGQEQTFQFSQAEIHRFLEENTRANQEAIQKMIDADRIGAEEKIRLAHEDYAEFEKSTELKVRLGTMTEAQRVAALRDAANKEKQIYDEQSRFIQMLDMNDDKRYAEDLKNQEELTRQWARQIQQINQEVAEKQQRIYTQTFSAITGPLNSFTDHWITSGKNMGQAFQKMYQQIAVSAINALLKIGEKWVAHELLITAAHAAGIATRKGQDAVADSTIFAALLAKLGWHIGHETATTTAHVAANATKVASDATAATASTVTASAANVAQATSYTAVASMGAAAAVAGIPIIGPALAAAAAASMSGMGAGYIAMAAFEQGGMVGGPNGMAVPILAHAGERVLSQSQTTNFERMVNQSTSSSSNSEVHFHDHSNWNGIDGASVENMYRQHSQAARRQTVRELRLAGQGG